MNKRAIAILGAIFILIVGTLGFLIYQRSKKKSDANTNVTVVERPTDNTNASTNTDTNTDNTPTATKATKVSDDAIISPILFYSGSGISYFTNSGQLFQTELQIDNNNVLLSNKHELSIPLKSGISHILWPQAGNGFLAEFNSSSKKTWSLYDSNRGAYIDLPSKISSIDWMPDGSHVMYVWVDNGKASLFSANADATGFKKIFDFFDPDNVIDVAPNGQFVLFYRTQNTDANNKIVSVTADGKSFKTIVGDGFNQGTLWSPDSKKFLFTKRDPSSGKFNLWVADITTGDVRNLGVTTTEKKAVWTKDSQSVFASVPTSGTAGQGLTQDTVYKIDVSALTKQEYQLGGTIDAEDMFLSSNENVLFFRNAQDNALYYLTL